MAYLYLYHTQCTRHGEKSESDPRSERVGVYDGMLWRESGPCESPAFRVRGAGEDEVEGDVEAIALLGDRDADDGHDGEQGEGAHWQRAVDQDRLGAAAHENRHAEGRKAPTFGELDLGRLDDELTVLCVLEVDQGKALLGDALLEIGRDGEAHRHRPGGAAVELDRKGQCLHVKRVLFELHHLDKGTDHAEAQDEIVSLAAHMLHVLVYDLRRIREFNLVPEPSRAWLECRLARRVEWEERLLDAEIGVEPTVT